VEAAIKGDVDGGDPVLVLIDSTALVGDLNDIEEFLAHIGGDYNSCRNSLSLLGAEDGVGPLLSTGGGGEVGVVLQPDFFELGRITPLSLDPGPG
jgi:hypothetical protein